LWRLIEGTRRYYQPEVVVVIFKLSDFMRELLSKFCQCTLSEIIHNGNFLVYSMGSVCFGMDTTFLVSYYGFGMELARNLRRIVDKYK